MRCLVKNLAMLFQFYIVALIAFGKYRLIMSNPISILYSSINSRIAFAAAYYYIISILYSSINSQSRPRIRHTAAPDFNSI